MPDPVSDEAVEWHELTEAERQYQTAEQQLKDALGWCKHLEEHNGYDLHDVEGYIVHALACLPFLRPSPREPSEEAVHEACNAYIDSTMGSVNGAMREAICAAYAVDCPVAGSALADNPGTEKTDG